MARHREFIRNWQLVREIELSRRGKSLRELAAQFGVVERTIRRDIAALQEAGVPLYDEVVDGVKRYKLDREVFRPLFDAGLTLSELCALYMSRSLFECLGPMPLQPDLKSAFDKIEDALAPRLGKYLDELPVIFSAKSQGMVLRDRQHGAMIGKLMTARIEHRKVRMRYHSLASRAEKDYDVHPHQLVHAGGALYLVAFVPAYGEVRTFAVSRLKNVSLLDERFDPGPRAGTPFPDSVGVFSGRPEWVEIEFAPEAAAHVVERQWHPTQSVEPRPDGSVRLRLKVSVDYALQSMILSFGPLARVLKPPRLAERIFERLEDARDRYAPRIPFEERAATRGEAGGQQPLFGESAAAVRRSRRAR